MTPAPILSLALLAATTVPTAAQAVRSGQVDLTFPLLQGGRGIALARADSGRVIAAWAAPAGLLVCGPCVDETAAQPIVTSRYGSVTPQPDGSVVAQARVSSPGGSSFAFVDRYRAAPQPNAFLVDRTVTVTAAQPSDQGFNSKFALGFVDPLPLVAYHILAPSIWYDHNANAGPNGFGADYGNGRFSWRETRSALPFVMLQEPDFGVALTLAHMGAAPSTGIDETTPAWVVDSSVQNGALGIQKEPRSSLTFIYPTQEVGAGSAATTGGTWVRRSHPVRTGFGHSYSLMFGVEAGLDASGAASFPVALRHAWRRHFEAFAPEIGSEPEARVFSDGIALLKSVSQNRGGAQGTPFTIMVDGSGERDSYQMGYTGQQIPAGFQLFRQGVLHGDSDALVKGQAMLDFWAYKAGQASGLPLTWYGVSPPGFINSACKNPLYMRSLTDGMEAMAEAAIFARQHGMAQPAWESFAQAFGDWLASHQNADGSFYRAFNPDGTVYLNTDASCTPGASGDSKLNTADPVRFLVELYIGTGQQRYLAAALAAGNVALGAIYGPSQYVGGTTDQPARIDKEGGGEAIHAALALFDATFDPKWLAAARQAADFAETWAYAFPFAINDPAPAFARTGPLGFSLVATGSTASDIGLSVEAYDFYRLYLFSGRADTHYLRFARFLQNDTKFTTQIGDTDQRYGYAANGLVGEATTLAFLAYAPSKSSRSWLTWLTNAEIDPLQRLEDAFGSLSIAVDEQQTTAQLDAENRHIYPGPGSIGWGRAPSQR